jgi:ribosomal protein S18 acetylase RimI-like enzyme
VALNVVAVIDGQGLGQVSGTTTDDRSEVELISMWVTPDVRGTGIGDALVREVVQWAQARGAGRVKLAVKGGNTHAIALYQRHGFVVTDEPAAQDEQTMALALKSNPSLP